MEENNLNAAPTEQELIDAGFNLLTIGYHKQVTTFTSIYITSDLSKCELCISGVNEEIELTKQKINDVFALFNKPLPQWEKPKPKVGEVWCNGETIYLINDGVLKTTIRATIIEDNELDKGTIVNIYHYRLTKLADSLEDYYKEKFLKNSTDWANKNEELDDELKQQESQITGIKYENQKGDHTFDIVEKECTFDIKSQEEESYIVHQYSYKGLKAKGKIPHDRSGEDHDSIEAFKKLLAICEALDNEFKEYINEVIYCPYLVVKENKLATSERSYFDESPIYFTSKEAFEAFKSAPENIELFKTFLKIK